MKVHKQLFLSLEQDERYEAPFGCDGHRTDMPDHIQRAIKRQL